MEIADAVHYQPKVSGSDDLGKRLNDQPSSFFSLIQFYLC